METIGVKNSLENVVRLVLRDELGKVKAAPPQSEVNNHSYMENSLNQGSKCGELLGMSGEQYTREVNCFDKDDHERSSLLDILYEQEESGAKVFEEEFCMFESFLQNRPARKVAGPDEEGGDSGQETPDGLGMQYLLKIDELPSEQSDAGMSSQNGPKKATETPYFTNERHLKKNLSK